ncbi:unnamed protein product [Gordionus sp. m RMFG-2023]|uniref:uncharacterized protein LOC135930056 n=1 Tax=Gordionus sp. m RMFG-2023 TaxID=3053472 RepID=UPI0030E4EFBC
MTSDMNENKTLSNLSSLPTNQKSLLFFDPHTFYNRVRNFLTTFSRSSKIYITDAYDHRCNGFFNDRADTKCPLNMLKEDGTQGNVFVNHPAYEPISSPTIKSIISGENIEFLNDFNSNHIVYAMTGPTFETLENFYDGKTRHQIKITLKNTLGHKNGYLKNSNEFIIHRSIVNCDALDNFKCGNENHGYVHSKDVNNNNIKRKGAHLDDISNIIPDNTSSDILLNSPYTSNGISLPFCNDDLIPTLKKIDPTSPGHIMPFEFQPDLLDRLLVDGCCVFARMTPECKTRLVLRYQRLDYYVGMCGDGANDCGALKAAHMGISMAVSDSQPEEVISDKNDDKSTKKDIDIEGNVVGNNNGKITLRHRVKRAFRCSTPNDDASKMEEGAVGTASLAAPFTATHGNVSCVPGIIKEGRASLATSFCVFKNMACYSLNQFVAVLSLYWFGTNFSDVQFAFADFFPATVLTMLMGYTQANPQLPTVQALSDTSSFSHKSKAKFN